MNDGIRPISRSFAAILFWTTVALGFAGCNWEPSKEQLAASEKFVTTTNKVLPPRSKRPTMNFFVDATLSMQGFVNPGLTQYVRVMNSLETAALRGWASDSLTMNYFFFGEYVQPVSRDSFLLATRPGIYNIPKLRENTHLEMVIDYLNKQKTPQIIAVVTDLFQNNSDILQVNEKLNELRKNTDYVIGLIAMKSEFQGTVYDITENLYQFDYDHRSYDQRARPFYLLLIGPYNDVVHFYRRLDETILHTLKPASGEFILFTPLPLETSLSFTRGEIAKGARVNQTSIGNRRMDEITKMIKFPKSVTEPGFDQIYPAKLMPYVLPSRRIEPKLEVRHLSKNSGWIEVVPAETHCSIENPKFANDTIRLRFRFLRGISDTVCYFAKLTLSFDPNQVDYPEWLSTWDMPITQQMLNSWSINKHSFDGSRTYNLGPFVRTLAYLYKSEFGTIYFYYKGQ